MWFIGRVNSCVTTQCAEACRRQTGLCPNWRKNAAVDVAVRSGYADRAFGQKAKNALPVQPAPGGSSPEPEPTDPLRLRGQNRPHMRDGLSDEICCHPRVHPADGKQISRRDNSAVSRQAMISIGTGASHCMFGIAKPQGAWGLL